VGIEALVDVVGYRTEKIIERYGEEYRGVPITDAHQRDQLGLAHALLGAEPYVEEEFTLLLGATVFRANLGEVVTRQRVGGSDAACPVEKVLREETPLTLHQVRREGL
jgi:glucose-1-phosphate thymidylyltransferase